jgi:hypothetical protein
MVISNPHFCRKGRLSTTVEDRHFVHDGPRSFFVREAGTVAIEPDALEAAR